MTNKILQNTVHQSVYSVYEKEKDFCHFALHKRVSKFLKDYIDIILNSCNCKSKMTLKFMFIFFLLHQLTDFY